MDNIHVVKKTTLTVEKKPLVLVLPYFGSISLQTRTKLKKSLKNILNCCKLQIVFKNRISKDLILVLFINFSMDSAMSPIMVNVWDTLMLELVNIWVYHHLPENKLNLKNSSVANHLLLCNHSVSYEDFSILMRQNKTFLLELKGRMLRTRDEPSLNRNIT